MGAMKSMHIELVNEKREEFCLYRQTATEVLRHQKGMSEHTRRMLCGVAMEQFNKAHKIHRELLALGA